MTTTEDQIVRRLRALIFVIFGLGGAAAVTGSDELRFFVLWFFVPGIGAYARPRWPAIVIWMMWASTIGMLGLLLAIGGKPELLDKPSHWFVGGAAALLFIAVPLVRRMHEAPPILRSRRIPEARIYRRG
jgi:hypothetical protein